MECQNSAVLCCVPFDTDVLVRSRTTGALRRAGGQEAALHCCVMAEDEQTTKHDRKGVRMLPCKSHTNKRSV